jgi:hypothetical protein
MSNVWQSPKAVADLADHLAEPQARGMIDLILSALHASRRRLARRVIRECARLIASDEQENTGGRA